MVAALVRPPAGLPALSLYPGPSASLRRRSLVRSRLTCSAAASASPLAPSTRSRPPPCPTISTLSSLFPHHSDPRPSFSFQSELLLSPWPATFSSPSYFRLWCCCHVLPRLASPAAALLQVPYAAPAPPTSQHRVLPRSPGQLEALLPSRTKDGLLQCVRPSATTYYPEFDFTFGVRSAQQVLAYSLAQNTFAQTATADHEATLCSAADPRTTIPNPPISPRNSSTNQPHKLPPNASATSDWWQKVRDQFRHPSKLASLYYFSSFRLADSDDSWHPFSSAQSKTSSKSSISPLCRPVQRQFHRPTLASQLHPLLSRQTCQRSLSPLFPPGPPASLPPLAASFILFLPLPRQHSTSGFALPPTFPDHTLCHQHRRNPA